MRPAAAAALLALAVGLTVIGIRSGGEPTPPGTTPGRVPAPDGEALFAQHGCGGCHRLAAAGSEGSFGPPLDENLRGASFAEIRRSIADPAAAVAAGWEPRMPGDYAARMTRAELDALAAWLAEVT